MSTIKFATPDDPVVASSALWGIIPAACIAGDARQECIHVKWLCQKRRRALRHPVLPLCACSHDHNWQGCPKVLPDTYQNLLPSHRREVQIEQHQRRRLGDDRGQTTAPVRVGMNCVPLVAEHLTQELGNQRIVFHDGDGDGRMHCAAVLCFRYNAPVMCSDARRTSRGASRCRRAE